jgi:hypothetical protein
MRCGYNLQEEGVKLLGVMIDENLDWNLHMNHVKKKISKGNYLLWRYKKQLTIGMKKIIYNSFIKCHLTYCVCTWGAKKNSGRKELIKQLKRTWIKIGPRKMHTNKRLINFNIYKLEDEIRIQEAKVIWRWEKNKIPDGLKDIIEEKRDRDLRNRQFVRHRNWKQDSIAYRLATRAIKEITEIECARSNTGLKRKFKKMIRLTYEGDCRIRNCFICTQNIEDNTR